MITFEFRVVMSALQDANDLSTGVQAHLRSGAQLIRVLVHTNVCFPEHRLPERRSSDELPFQSTHYMHDGV